MLCYFQVSIKYEVCHNISMGYRDIRRKTNRRKKMFERILIRFTEYELSLSTE
jgi:hypothetical protein